MASLKSKTPELQSFLVRQVTYPVWKESEPTQEVVTAENEDLI